MKKAKKTAKKAAKKSGSLLELKPKETLSGATKRQAHVIGKNIICGTENRAQKKSPFSIVLDATEGFVPLWEENLVLRWKFNELSLTIFQNPDAIKKKVRELLSQAITTWGNAAPIRFTENGDNSDFEIVVEQNDSCTPQGCTLAQAFFPDAGRHHLFLFPMMFDQSDAEQVETLVHEVGHVFGLRHFFALKSETDWPAEVFGAHEPFSIMNYGDESVLTPADKEDLKKLYKGAWNGTITKVNGTPIKLVRPYHYLHS
jgi:hypothetical protein